MRPTGLIKPKENAPIAPWWPLASMLLCMSVLSLGAQDVFTVQMSDNAQIISQGVTGVGMLDRASSSAFAKSPKFKQALLDYGAGSLRWPNAGHSNLLITHWDNDHTIYFGDGDPYSTKAAGNIWDPLYDPANAAPRTEIVDLEAFVDVLNATGSRPVMLFTWRSAELWRMIDGENVFYRDPEPFRLDGTPMPSAEAEMLSSREMQFLENNRQLKTYFELGGPDYPVVQIGGEVFIGWESGQEPWVLYNRNKGEWMAETLHAYFEDLNNYARHLGNGLQLMAQFKEANKGGHEIPTSTNFLRGEFDKLIEATGDIMSYYGCSMHYRHSYATWLEQSDMTWGFICDGGEGTAQEIYDWVHNRAAAKGFEGIQLIPHANSVGSDNTDLIPDDYGNNGFRKGLVNTQFMMELIEAGFPYANHYGGIKGGLQGNVGMTNSESIAYTAFDDSYQYNPVLHATGLIGEALMEVNSRPARLVGTTLSSGNADGKTQLMVIEPSAGQSELAANGGALDPAITQVLYAYVLNKRSDDQSVVLDLTKPVQDHFEAKRYSEGSEETAPVIADTASVVTRDSGNPHRIAITAKATSMTRIRIHVTGSVSTNNRPPRFVAPVIFKPQIEYGFPLHGTLADAVLEADAGDALRFSKIAGPAWLTVDQDGTLQGTPEGENLGLNSFQVEVSDGRESARAVLRITVLDEQPDLARWQNRNFTAYEISRGAAASTLDEDGDGLDNATEYAFGEDPRSPTKRGLPRIGIIDQSGAIFPTVSYHRRTAHAALNYTIQRSDDLLEWIPAQDAFALSPGYPQENGDGTETVLLRHLEEASSPDPLFLRVEAE